jgi:hypothetical protein
LSQSNTKNFTNCEFEMAVQKNKPGGRKINKVGNKEGVGVFDKKNAIRMVEVPVSAPGVIGFDRDVTSAERVWVEWIPSAALEGKRRRAFLSKTGITDPAVILTDGGLQLPRRGWSGSMADRLAVILGPGKFKIWVASERPTAQSRATVRELSSQLLQLVAPDDARSATRQQTAAPAVARRPA